jgi:hypothetical protein
MPDLTPLITRLSEATEREQRTDAAVRVFRDLNPLRWPCACIGCVITIRANFRALEAQNEK